MDPLHPKLRLNRLTGKERAWGLGAFGLEIKSEPTRSRNIDYVGVWGPRCPAEPLFNPRFAVSRFVRLIKASASHTAPRLTLLRAYMRACVYSW